MEFFRQALILTFLFSVSVGVAQEQAGASYIDLNYFQGNIMEHNPDLTHLVTGHPTGMILSWNKRTDGSSDWHQLYNYPDLGLSFSWQDMKNESLGHNFSLYAHANFYFFHRKMVFRIGQGLAVATNPYDKEDNFRNNVYGSRIMSSTYMMLNYKQERLIDRWGLNLGLSLLHYSNGSVKAPNTSTNSILFNFGVNYDLITEPLVRVRDAVKTRFREPLRYNFVFRSGVNESDLVGSGQFPFFVGSFYVDKRINIKSALQLGLDAFFSDFLIEYNRYRAIAYPDEGRTGGEDYRRVGMFAGHELFIGKTSLLTQFGYYLYAPVVYEDRVYSRMGLKRYLGDHFFGVLTLKTHWAKAEALELGIGYRL